VSKFPRGMVTHPKFVEDIITSAYWHGQKSEPEHQVGDLEAVLRTCWALLSPTERMFVYEEHAEILEWEEGS
jgi:hypothetical protein